jgi:hypothetical protein
MDVPVRVTTDPEYYEQHAESVELWSPGSPLFPDMAEEGTDENADRESFFRVLNET